MTFTRRGRRLATALAIAAGLGLGMTAQVWNPYTRSLDRCHVQSFEDGSSATFCAGHVVSVAHVDR